MRIILLERVEKLGFIGDVVDVKVGYAKNFLLPKKKALRATESNLEFFASKKADIEANNAKLKSEAQKIAEKMEDISITIIRQASESGFLYGSVRPSDIVESLSEKGFKISKSQVHISSPIKLIGVHQIGIILHPEVTVNISLRIMTAQEQGSALFEQEAKSTEPA